MKRSFKYIFLSVLFASITSCSGLLQSASEKSRTSLMDLDKNLYPIKRFPDNNLWMTKNLSLNLPGSYVYENDEKNIELYGRLYTWESARAGCSTLGKGWHLPTRQEWEQLAQFYGGIFETGAAGSGKEAYTALLKSGSSQFNAVLGGGRSSSNQYRRGNAHGFYWTSTESQNGMAYFYNFGDGSGTLYQQDAGEKEEAYSVRCVKSIN